MQSIRRLYIAKKDAFAHEERRMCADLKENLLIDGLKDVHLYNRYDLSGLDDAAFAAAKDMIFSEPPVDAVYDTLPVTDGAFVLPIEYLPGQYDQRRFGYAVFANVDHEKRRCCTDSSSFRVYRRSDG